MNAQDLIKQLKSIRCWVQSGSLAEKKIDELIIKLGGRI